MKGTLFNNYVPCTQHHNKHQEHSPNRTTLYFEISIGQCKCQKDTGTSDVFLTMKVLYNCNCIQPTNRMQQRVFCISTCQIHCYFQRNGYHKKTLWSGNVNGHQTSIKKTSGPLSRTLNFSVKKKIK